MSSRHRSSRLRGLRSAAGDEHVLAAAVGERRPVEVAVERLELEPRDVDEPEPLVLGRPPQRAGPRRRRARCRSGCRRPRTGSCGAPARPGAARRAVPRRAGRRRRRSRRTGRRDGATRRPVRRSGAGRPRSAGAAARGTGSRSAPPARRARGRACRPRAGRAPHPPRRRWPAPARASTARCRSRSPSGRSPARRGSRPGRSRRRARRAVRRPRARARRRTATSSVMCADHVS